MNNPTEIFCEACQKEASIPHGQPLVCPHCLNEATAQTDSIVQTPTPPHLPPHPFPKPQITEAQMSVQLLSKINSKLGVIQVMLIIWFALTMFGWLLELVGAISGRR